MIIWNVVNCTIQLPTQLSRRNMHPNCIRLYPLGDAVVTITAVPATGGSNSADMWGTNVEYTLAGCEHKKSGTYLMKDKEGESTLL